MLAVAGAEVAVFDLGFDGLHGGRHVKRLIVDGRHDELVALLQGHVGHRFFGAAEHHAVDAVLARLERVWPNSAGMPARFSNSMMMCSIT